MRNRSSEVASERAFCADVDRFLVECGHCRKDFLWDQEASCPLIPGALAVCVIAECDGLADALAPRSLEKETRQSKTASRFWCRPSRQGHRWGDAVGVGRGNKRRGMKAPPPSSPAP